MSRLPSFAAASLLSLAVAGPVVADAPAPATPPAASRQAPAAPRPTTAGSKPSRTFTARDLEALRTEHQPITYVDMPTGGVSSPDQGRGPAPAGVPARYRELQGEADAEIARLQKEKLAGTNPLLRGLSGSQTPRSTAEVEADLVLWQQRKYLAERGLANTTGSQGE